jgi:5-deoxy-5-amino-3-dehydroquinate synthase
MIIVPVELSDRSYDVYVGDGVRSELSKLIPDRAKRVAVVTQEGLDIDVDPGRDHKVFTIGDGERAKSMATVESLCRQFAQWGLTRADCIVGVGGGIVTDTAGFAAASYHRGVPVVHVATTLVAQVDAAIGGKTGVNIPEGKNLIGAYWQPSGVLCDTELLATLPPREFRCGLGEIAKYQFLGGEGIDALPLEEQVAACVAIKAAVVAGDEREGGARATLNYGHTLAHAIEIAGGHDLRHGEAVAIGLIFAAELAYRLGRIDADRVVEHRRVVGSYDLPLSLPSGLVNSDLISLMGRDKKALNGITFVLDGANGVESVTGVEKSFIEDSLDAIREPGDR